jgi:hypothetical protein
MSDDTSGSTQSNSAQDLCGAPTTSGGSCQLPADTCPHHDSGEDGTDADDGDDTSLPRKREWWVNGGAAVLTLMGKDKRDGESVETSAAKAALRKTDADASEWRHIFGPCGTEGCEKAANGFDADECYTHQQESDDESSTDDSGDDEMEQVLDTVEDLSDEQAGQLLKKLASR